MEEIVFDIETDGLIEEVSTVWCATFHNVDKDITVSFAPDAKYPIEQLPFFLESRKDNFIWVCHNMMKFDREVFKKLYDITLPVFQCQDTYLWSQMLYPDIPIPKGCNGKHGLDTWGTRFGIPKPKHEDWSRYSQDMLHRNKQDVLINVKLWEKIKKDKSGT